MTSLLDSKYSLRPRESSSEDGHGSQTESEKELDHQPRNRPSISLRQNEFFVERIIDSYYNSRKKSFQFYIKWEGFDDTENSWEDERNVGKEVIDAYFQGIKQESFKKVNSLQIESDRNRLQYKKTLLILERINNFTKNQNEFSKSSQILNIIQQIMCGLDANIYECFSTTKYTILEFIRFKDDKNKMNCNVRVKLQKGGQQDEVTWDWKKAVEVCPKELSAYFLGQLGIIQDFPQSEEKDGVVFATPTPFDNIDDDRSSDLTSISSHTTELQITDFPDALPLLENVPVRIKADYSSSESDNDQESLADIENDVQFEEFLLMNNKKHVKERKFQKRQTPFSRNNSTSTSRAPSREPSRAPPRSRAPPMRSKAPPRRATPRNKPQRKYPQSAPPKFTKPEQDDPIIIDIHDTTSDSDDEELMKRLNATLQNNENNATPSRPTNVGFTKVPLRRNSQVELPPLLSQPQRTQNNPIPVKPKESSQPRAAAQPQVNGSAMNTPTLSNKIHSRPSFGKLLTETPTFNRNNLSLKLPYLNKPTLQRTFSQPPMRDLSQSSLGRLSISSNLSPTPMSTTLPRSPLFTSKSPSSSIRTLPTTPIATFKSSLPSTSLRNAPFVPHDPTDPLELRKSKNSIRKHSLASRPRFNALQSIPRSIYTAPATPASLRNNTILGKISNDVEIIGYKPNGSNGSNSIFNTPKKKSIFDKN